MLPTASTRDGRANVSRSELPVWVMKEPVQCSEKPLHRKLHWGNQVQLDLLICICLIGSGRDLLFFIASCFLGVSDCCWYKCCQSEVCL